MSSVECLREFVSERLTAAAEEIFGVFKQTIIEYEEEIDRQRRLMDMVWKPEIKLHRIELPQQHVCKEDEVPSNQQLCIQERNSSLDQEDPEPPQIKEEQEELCTSQEGEQLVLKQETDTFTFTTTYEESDHSEPVQNDDYQLLSYSSHGAESQNTHTSKKAWKCETCGKAFNFKSALETHLRVHTGEKPYLCKTCGKRFCQKSALNSHIRIHTGERPYSCKTCGKDFRVKSILEVHKRIHTGEKPYLCQTCGKRFTDAPELKKHIRIHTGEKPYTCKTCGKSFRLNGELTVHMRRSHTGERPYLCMTCGKSFINSSALARHIKLHIGK